MKILMLTPYLPYPLLSGGQIRTYNLLKNLKNDHEITLFSLIKDESERKYKNELENFCHKVVLLRRTKNPWDLRNILLAGFTAYPFLVTRNMPLSASRLIADELKNNKYDLIHAETFYMMPNIPKTHIPTLLVEQTIEYLGYQNYAKKSKLWYIKPLLYIDIYKIKYWEQYFWKKANRLVTMSDEDRIFIKKEIGDKQQIDVVANGVDMEFFKSTQIEKPQDPTVLFVGTFKWLPNVDAVEYLVEKIWPLIIKKIPNAKLHIVGFSPNKKILKYANNTSIKVSGDIDDIRQVYGRAHILLAPIRSGKGTRYKILEAMATGLPIVGSKLSVEGLPVIPGQHVLVSNNTHELADMAVSLLKNEQKQKEMAHKGKMLVKEKFEWKLISKELDRIYRELGDN